MRYGIATLVVAVVTVGLLSLDAQQPASAQGSGGAGPAADIILTNGKVITVDDTFSIAQAVAVRGTASSRSAPIRTSRGWRVRTRVVSTCEAGRSSPG